MRFWVWFRSVDFAGDDFGFCRFAAEWSGCVVGFLDCGCLGCMVIWVCWVCFGLMAVSVFMVIVVLVFWPI